MPSSPRQSLNKSESSNYTANGDLAIKSVFVNIFSSAILNSQAGYRCTLVPRLPFPVPRSPFPVPRSPFPVPRSPFPVPRSPFPVPRSPLPVLVTSRQTTSELPCRTPATHFWRQNRSFETQKCSHFFTFCKLVWFLKLKIPFRGYLMPSPVRKVA